MELEREKEETEEIPVSIILAWFRIEIHTWRLQGFILCGWYM